MIASGARVRVASEKKAVQKYALRRWAVRHAGLMETLYRLLEAVIRLVRPVIRRIGFDLVARPLTAVERAAKGLLFDCHMCGACILTATGMACPMNCPKTVRNGPCGGVRPDGSCEIDANMPCVWVEAWRGAQRMRSGVIPATPNPPIEHHNVGKSSWLRLLREEPWPKALLTNAPHPSVPTAGSRLETLLREGVFVVTSECAPPDSADPRAVLDHVHHYNGCVDALNVTDGPTAHIHMSSLGVSFLLARAGWEPVMQMTCRDRNRIAIQGDLLSASALGIRNLVCLTGDGIANGDDPDAKPVFDLDVVSLLDTARRMRDDGVYRSGGKLAAPPRLFLGAVDNPFMPPFDLRPMRLAKKIEAGAQFVQTQYCFDIKMLERYMTRVREAGLHDRCCIIVGVGPIVSPRAARWMRAHVPGIHIPDDVIARLEQARDPHSEGIRMCIETIQQIRAIEGVAGIHLMAAKKECLIQEIVHSSGVLAGRSRPLAFQAQPATDGQLVTEGAYACPSLD
jgi:5,10-methylenetetrahydrofolate reductase